MNSKDLMIGNWVKTTRPDINGKLIFVESISDDSINTDYRLFNINELKPIPLTEEILLKCGFQKTKTMDYRINNNEFYDFLLMRIGFEYSFFQEKIDNEEIQLLRRVTFLHELQNLFYLLTKKELEVKL